METAFQLSVCPPYGRLDNKVDFDLVIPKKFSVW